MSYTNLEGRQQLLEDLANAVDELGVALAELGAAYELLDVATADKLEEELFGPTQVTYGRAKRTYSAFADRHGVAQRAFEAQMAGLPSTGAKGFIDNAVVAVTTADHALAELQDSPQLLEVGDAELRAAVAELRRLLADLPLRARELVRRLGR